MADKRDIIELRTRQFRSSCLLHLRSLESPRLSKPDSYPHFTEKVGEPLLKRLDTVKAITSFKDQSREDLASQVASQFHIVKCW